MQHEPPPLKQLSSSVNVEAIAAEVEKLIGQKAGVPGPPGSLNAGNGAPAGHNPISTFLSSVAQLQNALPGVNMMQLLQAVSGSQPSMMNSDVNMGGCHGGVHGSFGSQQPDIKSMLSQAQMQMSGQCSIPPPPPQVCARRLSSFAVLCGCQCGRLERSHRVDQGCGACRDP